MIKLNRPTCPNPTALSSNYKHPDNKKVLLDTSYHKCMYCESKITDISFGDVEHIKPKATYPQFTFDRNNLGIVCSKCNNNKSDTYDEINPFIDPYNDDPNNFFSFIGGWISQKNGNTRSIITIGTIDLNRKELLESRLEKIKLFEQLVDQYSQQTNPILKQINLRTLKSMIEVEQEYSAYLKSMLLSHNIS